MVTVLGYADRCAPLSETLGVHPMAVVLVRYRQLIRCSVRAVGFYSLLVGLATIMGGDERFQGPSYSIAVEIAAYLSATPAVFWGVTAMLAGGLALARHRSVNTCGLFGIVAWSVTFALSFLLSLNTHPLAGVTGVFAHGFIGLMTLTLLVVKRVDRGVDRR